MQKKEKKGNVKINVTVDLIVNVVARTVRNVLVRIIKLKIPSALDGRVMFVWNARKELISM